MGKSTPHLSMSLEDTALNIGDAPLVSGGDNTCRGKGNRCCIPYYTTNSTGRDDRYILVHIIPEQVF